MYLQTNDKSYLELAEKIADATITTQLVTDEGILREMKPEIDDSNDGVQFKGIFIRHLAFLYEVTKNPAYKDFILKNAESIITKDYDPTSKSFGCYWYGPFHKENSAANACALECVIEAYDLNEIGIRKDAACRYSHSQRAIFRSGSPRSWNGCNIRLWLIDKKRDADISAVPPKRDSLISVCIHVKAGFLLITGPYKPCFSYRAQT